MKVRVLYFALARDLAMKGSENMTVPEGSSLADLCGEIFRLHPSLERLEKTSRFSLNLDVVADDVQLREGDEVGVLPPVAGG